MTSAGLLDRLVSTAFPVRAPAKAATGIGMAMAERSAPLSSLERSPQAMARLAQDAYISNRHIRKAERLISQRFSTVSWHLEMPDDVEVDDTSPEPYRAIRDLLEKPYRPLPGDPITATPRTRSGLWSITSRHMGLCGYSAWYLDQSTALAGLPLQLLYLNPARLTQATNDSGQLVGWVLDDDGRGHGTPLDVADVIVFQLEPPDGGFLGTGLVASALSMVDLTRLADRHAAGVLASGGRLAGLVSPKGEETMPKEVYDQLVLDFRRVAESPESARRINILRGPVDFTSTSASPSDLDLVAIMNLTRDEVAELWNVPRSQMGGQQPVGLNSGDSKGYDEAILWQNAVGPRLDTFTETLQYVLLDRFAAAGLPVELEVEPPEFDDETPLYERASKATTLPLTNEERRSQVGLDPFPDIDGGRDPRNDEVWMASTMARIYPEAPIPPALLPFTGSPEPLQPPADPGPPIEDGTEPPPMPMKADASAPREAMQRALAAFLRDLGRSVAERVREKAAHLERKPSDVEAVFSRQRMERDLAAVLAPYLREVAGIAGTKAYLRQPVLERLLQGAGVRIKGISEATRVRVADIVRQGIADGLSAAELGDRIETASGLFDELRAETIARTETATMLNQASIAQYADLGVDRVQVYDGDEDEACAEADGAIWTLERAEAEPLAHPNCTRTFAPIVGSPA